MYCEEQKCLPSLDWTMYICVEITHVATFCKCVLKVSKTHIMLIGCSPAHHISNQMIRCHETLVLSISLISNEVWLESFLDFFTQYCPNLVNTVVQLHYMQKCVCVCVWTMVYTYSQTSKQWNMTIIVVIILLDHLSIYIWGIFHVSHYLGNVPPDTSTF